ncbi:MAG: UDP-3-O-(3-hydroxymyristoyl)glucosamine N-acyltransferase [Acidobacteriota bacterium]
MRLEGTTLAELAQLIDGHVEGASDFAVTRVRTLERAGAEHLSFVHRGALVHRAHASAAGALLVPNELAKDLLASRPERPLLVAGDSQDALRRVVRRLHPRRRPPAGVHSTAVVGDDCVIGADVHIGPYVVLGAGTRVGAGTVIEAHCVAGAGCRLGVDAWLHPHVVLYDDIRLGDRVELHSGTVLGADGFGYVTRDGVHHKMPQVGRVVLGDDVEVGALSAIDRAVLEETRIGDGSKIDNLVMVGHNVEVGRGSILCGQAGIAGSATLGNYVVLAGQAGVNGHLTIGDGATLAAGSGALQSIEGGRTVAGFPAVDLDRWRRQSVAAKQLPELMRRLRKLERRLERAGEDEPET